jgi:acetyl esterase/lipase
MIERRAMLWIAAATALVAVASPVVAQASRSTSDEIVRIWPGVAPGTENWTGAETTTLQRSNGKEILVTTNVSVPTITILRPAPGKANGTGMLVLPGGAFMALAWDLEGTEVAHWLADRGVTAFILKYRVHSITPEPGHEPKTIADFLPLLEPRRKIAVADASQAIRVVRAHAADYGVAPDRIGMIGFSAGAITTMGVLLQGDPDAQPDFAAPIYGMTMIGTPTVPANAPPLFIAAAQDDTTIPPESSTQIFNLWTDAKRPAELHLYAKGGHGFGMRPQGLPLDHWPAALEAWLKSRGLLSPPNAAAPPASTR